MQFIKVTTQVGDIAPGNVQHPILEDWWGKNARVDWGLKCERDDVNYN